MTKQYTPGPWKVSYGTLNEYQLWDEDGNFFDEENDNQRENAMLMEAAPDMLEALVEIEQMVQAGEMNEGTMEVVRNAIAKAMGL